MRAPASVVSAGDVEQILDRKRDAGEGPRIATRVDRGIDRRGIALRPRIESCGERVDRRVALADRGQRLRDDCACAASAAPDLGGDGLHRVSHRSARLEHGRGLVVHVEGHVDERAAQGSRCARSSAAPRAGDSGAMGRCSSSAVASTYAARVRSSIASIGSAPHFALEYLQRTGLGADEARR